MGYLKNKLPCIIILDGFSGVGKTFLLNYARKNLHDITFVGRKITNRPRRPGDNNWEFEFVKNIPKKYLVFKYQAVGSDYALDIDELNQSKIERKLYLISCTDLTMITKLRTEFNIKHIYIYRNFNISEFNRLLKAKGITNKEQIRFRTEEFKNVYNDYTIKLHSIDNVILNIKDGDSLIKQFISIINK